MKKILFITCRNIINSCGELRLIKNRALCLYQGYGISHDFLVYSHKEPVNREQIDAGGEFCVFKYNLINLFDSRKVYYAFKQKIRDRLKKHSYVAVVISGAPILELVDVVKNVDSTVPVFADCHGANEELLEFKGKNLAYSFARHALYSHVKYKEKRYLSKFDYILAVSDALKEYLVREYRVNPDRVHVVPCAVSRTRIMNDEILAARVSARKRYSIAEDEILFIYSGGTSPWQCIEESVDLFYRLSNRIKAPTKMLILSGDSTYISKFASDKIIIDSLPANIVSQILPAGDFAFLLRKNLITNRVAYPNKFLEYVQAGLKVICTPHVHDVANAVSAYQLGYILEEEMPIDELAVYVLANFSFGCDWDRRQALLDDVCFENRLSFWDNLGNER